MISYFIFVENFIFFLVVRRKWYTDKESNISNENQRFIFLAARFINYEFDKENSDLFDWLVRKGENVTRGERRRIKIKKDTVPLSSETIKKSSIRKIFVEYISLF